MLKKAVLFGLVVLIASLVAFIASQPADFRVERSTSIAAPPEVVFPFVNDLRQWNKWSPWDQLDPAMQKKFEGPASGAGSSYWWSGNEDVGEGRMTITASRPAERVDIKLEFIKPWTATSAVDVTLKPEAGGTRVTWGMNGRNDAFVAKAFSLLGNMDQMLGSDFEKGLAGIKKLAEDEAKKPAAGAEANSQPAAPQAAPSAPQAAPATE